MLNKYMKMWINREVIKRLNNNYLIKMNSNVKIKIINQEFIKKNYLNYFKNEL